jgi:hypothetical protein
VNIDIDYNQIGKDKKRKYNIFANCYHLFNRKNNKISYLKTFNDSQKERFYYVRDKFNLIHLMAMAKNKRAIFITSTVPSKFHNEKNIDDAYESLVAFRRELVNNFKVNSKRVEVEIINVIEPHESMIPHQHSVLYVDEIYVEFFLEHYYRVLRNHGFNKKGQDIKILDNAQYSILYLLKYVEKTIDGKDLKTIGWFSHHGFRQFQTSHIDNFNFKIWRLMIKHKDYFFSDGVYDFQRAYSLIDIKEIDSESNVSLDLIDDSSFTIYKVKTKIFNSKKKNSEDFYLFYANDNLIPTIERFGDIMEETEYMKYTYFIGTCPQYYIQEITPNISDNYDYNPEMVQVIQHSNCKEVIWLG